MNFELTQIEVAVLLRLLRVTVAQQEEILMQLQEQRRATNADQQLNDAMLTIDNYLSVLRAIRAKVWLFQIG